MARRRGRVEPAAQQQGRRRARAECVEGRRQRGARPVGAGALVQAQDDAGLLSFLSSAQPPVNPLEAFPHPYRGGYPELTDEQLQAVIGYLYTLPGAQ